MPSLQELEIAAIEVIAILRGIPDISKAKIAVIGGLALWKYLPGGRTTDDVDFIINVGGAPRSVKQALIALHRTRFVEQAQFFYYVTQGGAYIQIDITPEWQSPYMPAAATSISHIQDGSIPYISPTDLIVFKINSCGLRAQPAKRRIDAADAQNLLEKETVGSALTLSAVQKDIVLNCLKDVIKNGTKSEAWWKERLSL